MFTFIALLGAGAPTLIYTLLIWWLDRYEKEPLHLLVAAFLWGSLPAIVLAILFEVILATPFDASPLGPNVAIWGLAPLVEEPIKALALVALFLFARREFDGALDGIVYGALIGFGFSMTENLLFFIAYPDDFGVLFWLRGVVFGLNHAFFTSIVGLTLGAVRYAPQRWLGYVALPLSLLAAIALHSLHNYAVSQEWIGLALSWLVQSAGVLVVLAVAVLTWRHEKRWMVQELGEEIMLGTITPEDYAEAISAPRRTRALLNALLRDGLTHYRQVGRMHHLITELAFCKYQLRVGDRFQEHAERDRLRREIIALRNAEPAEYDAP